MANDERVALITGASRGLGAVVAGLLAERHYALVLGARHDTDLQAMADALRAKGTTVVAVPGDIAEPNVRVHLVAMAGTLGGLDLLVNNASELGGIGPLAELDLARLERVLHVNLVAPVALIQLALPLLTAANAGDIRNPRSLVINISSDAALGAYAGWGAYGASKAALDLVSRTLATELAERGVSVVSVDPGDMRTRMHQEAFPGEDISDRPLPEVTRPFWDWLLDEDPRAVNGKRFAAQREDAPWAQPA
jgi:NAD(P)-dependent dehydrogenase (short-subunit alcohol dehydrogenase family)